MNILDCIERVNPAKFTATLEQFPPTRDQKKVTKLPFLKFRNWHAKFGYSTDKSVNEKMVKCQKKSREKSFFNFFHDFFSRRPKFLVIL